MIERPSPNHERRRGTDAPDMVVLHYTGMLSARAAVDWLCEPRSGVSAHYLVDEDGTVVRMVAEDRRAWHAGVSAWRGASDVNSRSIGIEIHNPGHDHGYRPFPAAQVDALLRLLDAIRGRWAVPDERVLAHSDVAPARKVDPGELFPWDRLVAAGHGLWPAAALPPAPPDAPAEAGPIAAILDRLRTSPDTSANEDPDAVSAWQRDLAAFGYDVAVTGAGDAPTRLATAAFQRHFARHRLDGVADDRTRAILAAALGRPRVDPA